MTKRMLTAVLTVALTLSLTACGGRTLQEAGETRTVYTMDTVMNLTAYGENASAALDAAEETLRTLDAKLDRHDETSTVSALNRDGTVEDAELAQLTDIAQTIGALAGGAFDPTVAPVMDAWDFTGDAPRLPSDEELSALLAHVGLEKLSVDGNTIALSDGAQLDLGGIAKGYAGDAVRTVLAELNVTSCGHRPRRRRRAARREAGRQRLARRGQGPCRPVEISRRADGGGHLRGRTLRHL